MTEMETCQPPPVQWRSLPDKTWCKPPPRRGGTKVCWRKTRHKSGVVTPEHHRSCKPIETTLPTKTRRNSERRNSERRDHRRLSSMHKRIIRHHGIRPPSLPHRPLRTNLLFSKHRHECGKGCQFFPVSLRLRRKNDTLSGWTHSRSERIPNKVYSSTMRHTTHPRNLPHHRRNMQKNTPPTRLLSPKTEGRKIGSRCGCARAINCLNFVKIQDSCAIKEPCQLVEWIWTHHQDEES